MPPRDGDERQAWRGLRLNQQRAALKLRRQIEASEIVNRHHDVFKIVPPHSTEAGPRTIAGGLLQIACHRKRTAELRSAIAGAFRTGKLRGS